METIYGKRVPPFNVPLNFSFHKGEPPMKKSIGILAAVIVIAIVAGGAFYYSTRPATRQFTLQTFDYFFVQPGVTGNNPTLTVNSGDTVIITIQNMATHDHEFFVLTQEDYNNYIKALQAGQPAEEPEPVFKGAEVEDVEPGQTRTGTFVAGPAGTYVYACLDKDGTAPLTHANKGMFGTFQVNAGGGALVVHQLTTWLGDIPVVYVFQAYLVTAVAAVAFVKEN